MGKFLKFEKMITPVFIQIIFWVGVLASIIGGIAQIGFSFFAESGKFLMILSGLATMFIGPIIIRIYCEMLIVVFKMQSALIDIRDLHRAVQSDPPSTNIASEKAVEPIGVD